jgi:predicted AAA+ superfamily ATPase
MAGKHTDFDQLILYRGLLEDRLTGLVCQLLDSENIADEPMAEKIYCQISHELLEYSRIHGSQGDIWQTYFVDLMLEDENPFSLECERSGDVMDPELRRLALHDLRILQELYSLDWSELGLAWGINMPGRIPHFTPLIPRGQARLEAKAMLLSLARKADLEPMLQALEIYYREFGCGKLGRYNAFRWDGGLQPITHPDPITIDTIIGYDYQKQVLLDNTRAFVGGKTANNVLLYGAKGTGKSSSVKALLNQFADQGLRMVELNRRQLADIYKVTDSLRHRKYRFIFFIDDLSFEDFEVDYKYIKASMEGSLEVRPQNILFYVTSNRRHLIRENWSDRQRSEEEVFPPDSQQEKLSFADRFGISLAYLPPDQELYLKIVADLAEKEGITMATDALRRSAIQWELNHHGRSGRSARQFIDDLVAHS